VTSSRGSGRSCRGNQQATAVGGPARLRRPVQAKPPQHRKQTPTQAWAPDGTAAEQDCADSALAEELFGGLPPGLIMAVVALLRGGPNENRPCWRPNTSLPISAHRRGRSSPAAAALARRNRSFT